MAGRAHIRMGEAEPFSNELCGGTHVDETSDIGIFDHQRRQRAPGVRRIMLSPTGVPKSNRNAAAFSIAWLMNSTSPEQVIERVVALNETVNELQAIALLRQNMASLHLPPA